MTDNNNKTNIAKIEESILEFWQKEDIYMKSIDKRKEGKYFSFYDGPPFANGLPHFGHSLVTSIKDAVPRYKTMRGYYAPRRNGWDCHGLPVEYDIEKELNVSGKKEILELGIDKFNQACRASIFKYKDDWEVLLKRLGRWSDYENSYQTVDSDYTESVWWALAQIDKKGLLYKSYKCTAYCPRCETPLSNFEVNDGYKDDVPDPSLFVKFKLADEDAYLVGWTTTPWSLPGNAAIAVNPQEKYVYVETQNDNEVTETLIVARKRLEVLNSDNYKITKELHGTDLVGRAYEPLFDQVALGLLDGSNENLYKIWPADFVSVDDGTGVLHVAPSFGEDDLHLGKANSIPVLRTVDESGKIVTGLGLPAEGRFFKSADKSIIEELTKRSLVFSAQTFTHTYPFCWRCDTPLLYYAIDSWFIEVSKIRDQLQKTASSISWTPAHIKDGRFGKWLEGARDWAVSRNRYWGAPMPIWVNKDDAEDYIVVESYEKLRQLVGDDNLDLSDVHRPFIDGISFEKDGKTYERVDEVLDCWFESGCMSIAQQHYPFENKDIFDQTFPADFIIEGLDQTRLWFYVQHVVATILFDSPAFLNVVVNSMIMAADGQKLSKRLKNYPPVTDIFDNEGADSLRLYLLSNTKATQTADYMRFDRDGLKDINRNVINTLSNSLRFFKMYADIDNWTPSSLDEPSTDNPLDTWVLSRLNQAIVETTKHADNYKIAHAINAVFDLLDDLSNWYIRRSRRRFWKSDDDGDKEQAYETLWYVMTRVSQLLAPWAPFISEYVWRELTSGLGGAPASVHMSDWPTIGKIDTDVISNMTKTRKVVELGLGQRMDKSDGGVSIKVRQPISSLTYTGTKLPDAYHEIIADEVNAKEVRCEDKEQEAFSVVIDKKITDDLLAEGIMRDIVRLVQNARKKADLKVDDRIELVLESDDEVVLRAIKEYAETIKTETLALSLNELDKVSFNEGYKASLKLAGSDLGVSLKKAE